MLSKTNYKRFINCEASLWYQRNNYQDLIQPDLLTQDSFDQGRDFENLAQIKISSGLKEKEVFMIEGFKPFEYKEMEDATDVAINNPEIKMIFEASFSNKYSAFSMIDCLEVEEVGDDYHFSITEIKNSSSVKSGHILDISFQVWVLRELGNIVNTIKIAHRNSNFIRKSRHDDVNVMAEELITIVDVTDKVNNYISKNKKVFIENTQRAENVKKGSPLPTKKISNNCKTCPARELCIESFKDPSVFNLISRSWRTKNSLLEKNIISLDDLYNKYGEGLTGLKINEDEKFVISNHRNKTDYINKEKVKEHLVSLEFPIYAFDFETVNSAVPIFEESRPNQQIPFEASIHKLHENGKLEHFLYLQEEKTDPRSAMIEFLTRSIDGDTGSVVVFNSPFEIGVLKELVIYDISFKEKAQNIISRVWDLQDIYKGRAIYIRDFLSGWSLKKITKSCLSENFYEKEAVSDGVEAFVGYRRFLNNLMNDNETAAFMKGLKRYNAIDTMIPLIIIKELFKIIDLKSESFKNISEDNINNMEN